MSKKLYEENSIKAIANAIRTKNGSTNTYKVADMSSAILNLNGAEKLAEFSQLNEVAQAYIDNVSYTDDYSFSSINDYTDIATDYRKDQPVGHTVTLKKGKMQICDDDKVLTADSVSGTNTIYNLTPNRIGNYINVVNDNITKSGTLKATGVLRMIKADSVNNVRDLGGWTCDGGTIKYGLLFRGGELNGEHDVQISDADIKTFKQLLGIESELDLRGNWELDMDTTDTSDDIVSSALGDDVNYLNLAIEPYKNAIDLSFQYYKKTVSALKYIFNNVTNKAHTYFHCVSGADRTGTIALLIEALLGVSQSDIDKDYEITSFTNETGIKRVRTDINYVNLINYLKSMDGSTLADKTASWFILAGFTIDEINKFRRNMINGNPVTLTNQIDYNCKSITLDTNSLNLNAGDTVKLTANLVPLWSTDSINWAISNDNVSLSANGKNAVIQGLKAGATVVTATCNGHTVTCEITVKAQEITYTTIINGISAGTKISSSDYKTETTGQVNYGSSDYIEVTGYSHYKLSNSYAGLHPENIANEYLIFYDSNKNYISKTNAVPNKALAVADELSGEIPSNATYMRLRAYCSSTVEEQRSGYFSGSIVKIGK